MPPSIRIKVEDSSSSLRKPLPCEQVGAINMCFKQHGADEWFFFTFGTGIRPLSGWNPGHESATPGVLDQPAVV